MSGLTWGLLVFSLCNVLHQKAQMPWCKGSDILGRTWGERTITWEAYRRGKIRTLTYMSLCEIPTEEITVFKNQKNNLFYSTK